MTRERATKADPAAGTGDAPATEQDAELSTALRAALCREQGGGEAGEARAREAFRAARYGAGHTARRTRRRDDWRPVAVRGRWRGALRTTAFGVAATVLLGGVAVAAAGTLDRGAPAPEPGRTLEHPETPDAPGPSGAPGTTRGTPAAPGATDGPDAGAARRDQVARDEEARAEEARCRAALAARERGAEADVPEAVAASCAPLARETAPGQEKTEGQDTRRPTERGQRP
ncbi:hypothetical protein [Streptomyces vilmorinianum]|uniref:hypothetical protein n=1 Tax=Streptomyces vilmorinianum TaxID=3051092 RepID=UPI0010FB991C|nr:hypothetical protein [Streptomyces vilmorinianum]